MIFQDFLDAIEDLDFEVETESGYETNFSFCWSRKRKLSSIAKKRWKSILESEISIREVGDLHYLYVKLLSTSIFESDFDEFMSAQGGYCSVEDYKKWFDDETEIVEGE